MAEPPSMINATRSRSYLLAALLFLVLPALATEIHYLDLQQNGSSAIVIQDTSAGRKVILIDAGNASRDPHKGGARVVRKLRELKITRIDLAIVSHMDADHFGGYRNLLGTTTERQLSGTPNTASARGPPITITTLLEPGYATDKPSHGQFQKNLAAHGVERVTLADPHRVQTLERAFDIRVFAPRQPRGTNASSLLVRVDDRRTGTSQLLTGDTTKDAWDEIKKRFPRKRIKAITAPHHGGDRVLLDLVEHTQPDTIIFQANRGNQFRHPSLWILRHLAARGHNVNLRALERAYDVLEQQHREVKAEVLLRREEVLDSVLRDREIAHEHKVKAAQAAARSANTYHYSDILITGERGDIRMTPERVRTTALQNPFLDEAIWNRLRHVTDAEIAVLRTWDEARAYLQLLVREDLELLHAYYEVRSPSRATDRTHLARSTAMAYPLSRPPAWITEYENIVAFLEPHTGDVGASLARKVRDQLPRIKAQPVPALSRPAGALYLQWQFQKPSVRMEVLPYRLSSATLAERVQAFERMRPYAPDLPTPAEVQEVRDGRVLRIPRRAQQASVPLPHDEAWRRLVTNEVTAPHIAQEAPSVLAAGRAARHKALAQLILRLIP